MMTVRKMVIAGVAALAACGVLGMVPAASQVSSAAALHWTKQHPAASPRPRFYPAMAYDAATGTAVLFGGQFSSHQAPFGDTWTWDGTTWAQQNPETSPHGRYGAAMAYDAATSTVVLFGGNRGDTRNTRQLADTWTWDGTAWTKQAPAVHPSARVYAAMAYDAATGTAVLFGGESRTGQLLGDTWTWDGSTWTKQTPAVHPSARDNTAMAYDAATGTVVLFGGHGPHSAFGDTWTWDGSTWTKLPLTLHPSARDSAAMAYDAATGTVVLSTGENGTGQLLNDTWTWDGTSWTQQTQPPHPPSRAEGAMAYDTATGTAVLFGGRGLGHGSYKVPSTWTWG